MATKSTERYTEGIGRRKTAVARVRIIPGAKTLVTVNEKPVDKFFQLSRLQKTVTAPLDILKLDDKFAISAKVNGGGVKAQAEAVRHGLARALILWNPDLKKMLRSSEFLTRDSRMVERKKPGLKKARRAPQWAKR
jgi:small subunit ribosomal protein S9